MNTDQKSKALSYSLFGFGKSTPANCFEFVTYLRGMWTNMRVNRVLYPGCEMIVNIDQQSWNSPYNGVFKWAEEKGLIRFIQHEEAPLCMAMLWRLKPVFEMHDGAWKYTHVLCRDIDSIATYRERQMVDEWIAEDKTIHCITDSISHNIPMMGGMIGIRPAYISSRMNVHTFDKLIAMGKSIDFSRKGSDQDFLNRIVYPKNSESATEHFILGMRHNLPEGDGRHYRVPDITLSDVTEDQRCTNDLCGHVGSAGCYEPVMIRWLNTMDPFNADYAEIERQYPQLFFWRQ